jgi:hypothetical protein
LLGENLMPYPALTTYKVQQPLFHSEMYFISIIVDI